MLVRRPRSEILYAVTLALAAALALAVVMIAIGTRRPRRAVDVRLEGTRAVARQRDRIVWSIDGRMIRSVLLRRSDRGRYEVTLALRGGGTLAVPGRFDVADGHELGSELWAMVQDVRARDGYRG